MSESLRGWQRTFSGDGVAFENEHGKIRVQPGLHPLQPFAAIMRSIVPVGGDLQGPVVMLNAEGEYGAMVNAVKGDEQITLVVLFGDTSYAQLIGRTNHVPSHKAFVETVRKMAYGHSLGLGSDRRRPYLYERPVDWSGVRRPYSTLWIAPDAAKSRAVIETFHARPARNSIGSLEFRRVFEQLSREFGEQRPTEPISVDNRHGIQNQLITYTGAPRGQATKVTDIALADGRMLYLVRLTSRAEAHDTYLPTVQRVARSVRPLVPPRGDVDVLIDWFD